MKKLSFLVALITDDNDYQVEQATAAEESGRRLGVSVQVIYAGNDAINQSQQLLKVIQSSDTPHPDAIISSRWAGPRFLTWRLPAWPPESGGSS